MQNPRPRARAAGLVVRELPEEVLVYDLERHRAVCLNRTAALVWKSCDGLTSVGKMSRLLAVELRAPVPVELIWLALEQLGRERLLEEKVARPPALAGMSRRELIRRLGLAAAVTLPLVISVLAPTAAQALSCVPTGGACATSAQCCPNNVCVASVCVGGP